MCSTTAPQPPPITKHVNFHNLLIFTALKSKLIFSQVRPKVLNTDFHLENRRGRRKRDCLARVELKEASAVALINCRSHPLEAKQPLGSKSSSSATEMSSSHFLTKRCHNEFSVSAKIKEI